MNSRVSTHRRTRIVLLVAVLSGLAMAYAGCSLSRQAAPPPQDSDATVKNVILVIGDGMGPQQVGLLLHYARMAPGSVLTEGRTAFDRMTDEGATIGFSMTYPATGIVVDSAASATQLASGRFTRSEVIGLDAEGVPVEGVVQIAIRSGKSTGIVSDTRLTHATPAAFFAHQPHRDMENEIALDAVQSGVDVMLSGGLRHFLPREVSDDDSARRREIEEMIGPSIPLASRRSDDLDPLEMASTRGYQLVFDREGLVRTSPGKALGLFASSALPYAIDSRERFSDPERTYPLLHEMTAKALELLSTNDEGFFLMVEAGLIDWALHYNDAGSALHELLMLDATVNLILDWMEGRDDTVLIVTGDHETGGFGFSYSGFEVPQTTPVPGWELPENTFSPGYNFVDPRVLDRVFSQRISYARLFMDLFDSLPEEDRSAAALAELVNANTDFAIDEAQAERILETEPNPFFIENHPYLGETQVPRIDDFKPFYPYPGDDNRLNLLAREVAAEQGIVWSTGSHTCTPALVFVGGPESATRSFSGIMHHTDLANRMIHLIE